MGIADSQPPRSRLLSSLASFHLPTRGGSISVPDRIAWFRIALVPIVMALVLVDGRFDGSYGWAAAIFAVAAVSDFLDGFLARRWQQASKVGAWLDSMADKVLVTGVLFALVAVDRAWAWAAFVIVAREIAVLGLRGIVAIEGRQVPASSLAKLKTTFQFVAMGFAMLRFSEESGPLFLDEWVMLLAVALTLASAIDYFVRFAAVVRRV